MNVLVNGALFGFLLAVAFAGAVTAVLSVKRLLRREARSSLKDTQTTALELHVSSWGG